MGEGWSFLPSGQPSVAPRRCYVIPINLVLIVLLFVALVLVLLSAKYSGMIFAVLVFISVALLLYRHGV